MDKDDGFIDHVYEAHLKRCRSCQNILIGINSVQNHMLNFTANDHNHGYSETMPTKIGNYKIIKELSRGGMGQVFLAKDSFLQRKVAIKVIRRDMAQDKEYRNRFLTETRILAQFNHSHITTIFGAGEDDGFLYLVMEYIEGNTINRISMNDIERCFSIFHQMLTGVSEAHKQGVIHRDLKPSNMMLNKDGCLKILDFGISCSSSLRLSYLSEENIVASNQYVAPEIKQGNRYSVQSDLYSLGIIFAEMINDCFSDWELKYTHGQYNIHEQPLSKEPEIQYLLNKLLHDDPNQRFASVQAAIESLEILSKNRTEMLIRS